MLLFVKKRFADAIRSGEKTIEIRAGARYRNLRAGNSISINGQFRRRVTRVECCAGDDLIAALRGRFNRAGFSDEQDTRASISECYRVLPEIFYLFHLANY